MAKTYIKEKVWKTLSDWLRVSGRHSVLDTLKHLDHLSNDELVVQLLKLVSSLVKSFSEGTCGDQVNKELPNYLNGKSLPHARNLYEVRSTSKVCALQC